MMPFAVAGGSGSCGSGGGNNGRRIPDGKIPPGTDRFCVYCGAKLFSQGVLKNGEIFSYFIVLFIVNKYLFYFEIDSSL